MRQRVAVDSGAGDNFIPKSMANRRNIKPSVGSRRGLHYVSTFRLADFNKPLDFVSDRIDDNCRVLFDQDDETA